MGHFSLARLVAVIGALSVRPGTASPVAEPYGHAYGHGYGDGYGYGSVTSQTDAAATTTSTLAYYGYQANSDDPASSTASDNCTSSSIISDAAPTSLTTYPAEYGYGDPSASTSASLNYTNNSPSAYLPYTAPNVYTTTIYTTYIDTCSSYCPDGTATYTYTQTITLTLTDHLSSAAPSTAAPYIPMLTTVKPCYGYGCAQATITVTIPVQPVETSAPSYQKPNPYPVASDSWIPAEYPEPSAYTGPAPSSTWVPAEYPAYSHAPADANTTTKTACQNTLSTSTVYETYTQAPVLNASLSTSCTTRVDAASTAAASSASPYPLVYSGTATKAAFGGWMAVAVLAAGAWSLL